MVRTLLLVALLGGAVARADEPAATVPDADREAKAKELFAKGNKLLKEGDTRGALAMYRSAYAHYPNPKLLLNIGTLLRRLGRNADAANTYERYLSEQGFDASRAPEVANALAALEPLVGRLRIEATMGSQVRVDDEDIGVLTQATTVRVEPGTHTVYAEREGFEPATVSITVAAGEELQVPIALEESSREGAGMRSALWPESSQRADAEARFRVEPRRAESPYSHASHVGVTARSETDLASGGTGSAFGATVGLGRYVEAAGMALIQRDKGLRVAASVWLMPDSAAKPFLRLGLPVFFGDGSTSAGFHAGGGVVWDIVPRFGVTLDIALEHFPGAPDAREKTAGVLGAGLYARLF